MILKCVIFDFDGTLFDSMYVWKDAGTKYLNSLNIRPEDDFNETVASMTLRQAAAYVQKAYHIDQTVEQIMEGVSAIVADDYANHIEPAKGVTNLLDRLYSLHVTMVIATLSERNHVLFALKRCHLDHYFTDIITAEDVHTGKDSPLIYEKAMCACKAVKENTAVVEDAYYAAKTAHDAGFTMIGVYENNETQQEQMKEVCDLYVEDLSKWKVEEYV